MFSTILIVLISVFLSIVILSWIILIGTLDIIKSICFMPIVIIRKVFRKASNYKSKRKVNRLINKLTKSLISSKDIEDEIFNESINSLVDLEIMINSL